MPIPHDYNQQPPRPFMSKKSSRSELGLWRTSEESIGMEDCDGPVLNPSVETSGEDQGAENDQKDIGENLCTDRAELIERIKRGESPTWVPNQALKQEYLKSNHGESPYTPRSPVRPREPSPLLPAAEVGRTLQISPGNSQENPLSPVDIQRPKSALHAGNFTEAPVNKSELCHESPQVSRQPSSGFASPPLGISPTQPWYTPSSSFQGFNAGQSPGPQEWRSDHSARRPWRNRAPSLNSYSSSYVLKAPTTPLVQQSNNTDLDSPSRDPSLSPGKRSRRRTLPPHAFQNNCRIGDNDPSQASSPFQSARHSLSYQRQSSFPYGHHPRRSLASNCSLHESGSPQTPAFLRSRRTSFSETSPRQHASLVGSYEESILRGWMSTAPSHPLDFTAQIGVLGKGTHKPKCPAHRTIPFPAVFYSWGTGDGKSTTDEDPSPYVGHIDLQGSLMPTEPNDPTESGLSINTNPHNVDESAENGMIAGKLASRKPKRRRRTSPSSVPPLGGYRIPQQGQIQIVIKNPNKTAVKLFLVPYDLEGMEPGTKTFIRQRSYSADPVVDGPIFTQFTSDTLKASRKPTLRYLIHLNVCSPSKGRYYLYQQIRVVFANRVPDNKEQLRNEIQLPQPRFSVYKPNRESMSGLDPTTGSKLTAEKGHRRPSSILDFGGNESYRQITQSAVSGQAFSSIGDSVPPIAAIPFDLTVSRQKAVAESNIIASDAMELDTSRPPTSDGTQSPLSDKTGRIIAMQSPSSLKSNSSQGSEAYSKLSKGESGYGGIPRSGTPEPGEGLLARRLKELGVKRYTPPTADDFL